ncbi:His-Xaa-Ser repeat protein HxsA2 [Limnohabitans sp. Hippo3]|uniref:His-Xaa-Ser repeat protein HxsA2 n=1 Tax=Limnohabitans sp. Hippo3 TaxID=1597956 RepID=UPI0011B26243|nr:His-Xaa-Ser repeat protein HxsA2 [Limnohabitans sp. Hippo3]
MKKFLTAFASLAAAFAADAAPNVVNAPTGSFFKDSSNIAVAQTSALGENISVTDDKGDEYNFVLKRAEDSGLLMAYHSSHRSHQSHSSHRSHYSSYRDRD